MCRAQFEHDDIAEAQIVCSTGLREASETGEAAVPDRVVSNGRQTKFFGSWRRPIWFSLSYSTVRQYRPVKRQPNPFGPPHSPSFSRLASPDIHETVKQDSGEPSVIETNPRTADFKNGPRLSTQDLLSLVVPHAPTVAWDDESHIELPYDNPYYRRSVDNVLWLPRDPFGVLDLDDTVDLRVSITSEPTAGQLGTWLAVADTTESPRPMSQISNPDSLLEVSVSSPLPKRKYTGLEEISLPSGIAKRVQALDKEDDVEDARERRPSFFSRTSSSRDKTSDSGSAREGNPRIVFRKPSDSPSMGHRTYAGNDRRLRASSLLSISERPQRGRSATESIPRPDIHAQAHFSRSHLSVVSPSMNQATHQSRSRNITTQEAVMQEIIAEEGEARAERLRDEEANAEAAKGYKSWLTSWLSRPAS
jgi:hypothetical protein